MGLWTHAIVEYSGSTSGADSDAQRFESIDFCKYGRLVCGKDCNFLDLFFGIESKKCVFPLRGIPVDASAQGAKELDVVDGYLLTWLNYSELMSVIKICGKKPGDFSLAVQVVLHTMGFLAEKLGPERVRILVGAD